MHAEERYLAAASERGQRSASETPCAESSGRSREPEIESQLSGLVAALGADVEVWIVRPPVLPASPEHADPGSSQDADRVRVVTATCPSGAVLLRGPLTGVSAVVGEGHERSAKPLVAGQAKEDGKLLSRGARNGRGTGFGGKLALGDEARSKRARSSPSSARTWAAWMRPERGNEVTIWASGWSSSAAWMALPSREVSSTKHWSVEANARTTVALDADSRLPRDATGAQRSPASITPVGRRPL